MFKAINIAHFSPYGVGVRPQNVPTVNDISSIPATIPPELEPVARAAPAAFAHIGAPPALAIPAPTIVLLP